MEIDPATDLPVPDGSVDPTAIRANFVHSTEELPPDPFEQLTMWAEKAAAHGLSGVPGLSAEMDHPAVAIRRKVYEIYTESSELVTLSDGTTWMSTDVCARLWIPATEKGAES